jgi:hypothetical protein
MNNIVCFSGILVPSTYTYRLYNIAYSTYNKRFLAFLKFLIRFVICSVIDKKNFSPMYNPYSIIRCQPNIKILIIYYLVLKSRRKKFLNI